MGLFSCTDGPGLHTFVSLALSALNTLFAKATENDPQKPEYALLENSVVTSVSKRWLLCAFSLLSDVVLGQTGLSREIGIYCTQILLSMRRGWSLRPVSKSEMRAPLGLVLPTAL